MPLAPAVGRSNRPPKWIKPQLTRLVDEAPTGKEWVHEIKYGGYRMHARIDGGKAVLLTRSGLDWSHRYGRTVEALQRLPVKSAYLDGELCPSMPRGYPFSAGSRQQPWTRARPISSSSMPSTCFSWMERAPHRCLWSSVRPS
ncbi:ATP-dependent DNA ligase [Reyranella soli]|uniref:ATP-dependent DNA ligase family profile domain-containing protein n=1 Tax=Reyranella soli TaxID=1230389 RepID=A0A512NSQ0_9HYPH|nr:hypothetical protein [Reyranella soli]GEP61932.1 hypothetical protein RSO01_90980 [Reyranella soli]